MTTDAIVLAGGAGRRMGGVDKPALVVGARSLLDIALAAVSGCRRIVVVGPPRNDLPPHVRQTREDPPQSGPVAAIAAGLATLHDDPAELVVILAADLPLVAPATIDALAAHLSAADAAFAVDDTGHTQYLVAVWRSAILTEALATLGDPANRPVRAIVPAHHVRLPLPGLDDCDTPDDLAHARRHRR